LCERNTAKSSTKDRSELIVREKRVSFLLNGWGGGLGPKKKSIRVVGNSNREKNTTPGKKKKKNKKIPGEGCVGFLTGSKTNKTIRVIKQKIEKREREQG